MSVLVIADLDDPPELDALRRLAVRVIAAEGFAESSELGITLVTPDAMASLNSRHLGGVGPTDVISLPVEQLQPGVPLVPGPDDPPVSLGDVFLCPDEVALRAPDHDRDPHAHLDRLLVHGILHLLGYEHDDDADADRMERREESLLGVSL